MDGHGNAVEIKILDPRIRDWGFVEYQSDMAAALDLFACIDAPLVLAPQATAELVPSGLALHMADPGVAALVLPRSGLGHKTGLVLGNAIGLIDADYTGQVFISAWNRSAPGTKPVTISPGDRIAQLMFVPVLRPRLQVVDIFSSASARGAGGFGSTGV